MVTDFNFLPWRDEQRELRKRKFWYLAALVSAFAVAHLLIRTFVLFQKLDLAAQESARFQQQLIELEPALVARRAMQGQLADMESLLAQLESLRSLATPITELESVSAALPSAAHYSLVSREGDSLYLSGEASGADLSAMMQALANQAEYQSVELAEFAPATGRKGIHSFTLLLRPAREELR